MLDKSVILSAPLQHGIGFSSILRSHHLELTLRFVALMNQE
jgi:hypothetical protein